MRTPQENVKHMEEMGYTNIKPEMFYNSAMAARNISTTLPLPTSNPPGFAKIRSLFVPIILAPFKIKIERFLICV